MRGRILACLIVPALAAGTMLVPNASAQTPDIPSVGVVPVGTSPNDPNGGQWFVATLSPGQTVRLQSKVTNPASVPQTVRLFIADLQFSKDGTPQVVEAGKSTDVGTWGGFDTPQATIPAHGSSDIGFSLTAPKGADAGDHVGVVVAETAPQPSAGNGQFKIVKRVATRLYATIPGDAQHKFAIEKVKLTPDSTFFPREMTIVTTLRNTGRVRLRPVVTVGTTKLRGSDLLLSSSVEEYTATVKIPFWGGPLRYRVVAATDAGTTHQTYASVFLFPWYLLVLAALVAGLLLLVRFVLSRRGGKYSALKADMHRLERLLAQQAGMEDEFVEEPDPEIAIRAKMKQARRAGAKKTEERLRAVVESPAEPVRAVEPEPEPEPEPVVGLEITSRIEPEPETDTEPAPGLEIASRIVDDPMEEQDVEREEAPVAASVVAATPPAPPREDAPATTKIRKRRREPAYDPNRWESSRR